MGVDVIDWVGERLTCDSCGVRVERQPAEVWDDGTIDWEYPHGGSEIDGHVLCGLCANSTKEWLAASGDILAGKCPGCKAPTEDSWLTERGFWRCPECNTPPTMMEMTR